MVNIAFLVFLLSLISHAMAMTPAEADKWCQDQKGPGYKAKLDDKGNPIACETSASACFGNEYTDPKDGTKKCCPVFPVNQVYSYDEASNTGACCPTDQKWSYHPLSGVSNPLLPLL
jgi:hypothetical protein